MPTPRTNLPPIFQNTSLTWGNGQSYPGFTDCFQNTVMVWIASGWVFLSCVIYIPHLLKQPSDPIPRNWRNITKQVSRFFLALDFCVVIRFFIPVTTALTLIFNPRFYPVHLFSYPNSGERASIPL